MQVNKESSSNIESAALLPVEAEHTRHYVVNTIARAFSLFDRQEIDREVGIELLLNAGNGCYYYRIVVSESLQVKIESKKKAIDELPGIDRIKSFLDLRSDEDGNVYEVSEYYDLDRNSVIGMYSQKQGKYVDSLDSDEFKALFDKYSRIMAAYRYSMTES